MTENNGFTNRNILLTCDDGADSRLMLAFYEMLAKDNNVTVIAPESDVSGTSAAATVHDPIVLQKARDKSYKLKGYIVDCVAVGCSSVIKEPFDCVIAGINTGLNTGRDIIYSANVMAAREAAVLGKAAIVISVEGLCNLTIEEVSGLAIRILRQMNHVIEKGIVYNINIPDGRLCELSEIVFTRPANENNVTEFWVDRREGDTCVIIPVNKVSEAFGSCKNTDTNAIKNKKISISMLKTDVWDCEYEGIGNVLMLAE